MATAQLRRAAWSVANNIAEGNGRKGNQGRRRFFDVSLGSLAEVDSMIATLVDLYDLDPECTTEIEVLRRTITAGLVAILKRRPR